MSKFTNETLLSKEQVLEVMTHRADDTPLGEEARNRKVDPAQELRSPEDLYDSFMKESTFYEIDGKLCRVLPVRQRRILPIEGGTLNEIDFEVVSGRDPLPSDEEGIVYPNEDGFFNLNLKHKMRTITTHLKTLNRAYRFFYARAASIEPQPTGQTCVFTGAATYYPPQPAGIYISSKALTDNSQKQQKDDMKPKAMEEVGENYLAMVVDGLVKFNSDQEKLLNEQAANLVLNILDNRTMYAKQVAVEETAAALDNALEAVITDEGVKKATVVAGFAPTVTKQEILIGK